jgi:hypothetical protein
VLSITGATGKSVQALVQLTTGRSSGVVIAGPPSVFNVTIGGPPSLPAEPTTLDASGVPASGISVIRTPAPPLLYLPAEQQITRTLPKINPADLYARIYTRLVSWTLTADHENAPPPPLSERAGNFRIIVNGAFDKVASPTHRAKYVTGHSR